MLDVFGSPWLGFALGVLAVWRLTHLLHVESGPGGVFDKGRKLAGRVGLGELFQCFHCLSLWIAMPAALYMATGWPERVIMWLAFSGAAIAIEVKLFAGPAAPRGEE